MIRRFFIIALMLISAAPAMALDRLLTPQEEQMIREINAHNSAIRTMVGRFLQIDTNGGRVEGTFYIERPGKVRFRYAPPSREEIISVGRGFYVIDRRERTQYAYPQDRVPLRQFLEEKIDLFSANIIDVVTTDDFISVVISDDTPIGVIEVALIFDIASKDLKQWTLTEPSGAELTFSLYDVSVDVDIPKSYFYIDPTYKPKTQ
ncbi:LolA family protein [Mariluticola halotolerans]|uniref:LolA family protein n=1 Tax=Mariluticola halotolerans TaxID=2909283 RepID=UPI0026E19FD6|nr:outer membrane lipoprotein carrier protein LolA [Mariluticola halotolerans]UJQ93557.1 outer membrane lipoprotein carrier protein LolA [Mariluticola halotolerans]